MKHRIIYTPTAESHLRSLSSRDRTIVHEGIERQLTHEPSRPTRNRKRMRPNPIATWELRIGPFRVYYRIVAGFDPGVVVEAVAVKIGNRAWAGGEEVDT